MNTKPQGSIHNLAWMLSLADIDDQAEGLQSYERYNLVMQMFADQYECQVDLVTAAFCALSPNNDYLGNLRSLASVLKARQDGTGLASATVSTYRHCAERAWNYITGLEQFDTPKRGLKIRSFYRNITNPHASHEVTVDGHVKAAWVKDPNMTMKQAIVRSAKEYNEIADAIRQLAISNGMRPHQVQAIIWFTRKRVYQIKFNAQLDVFGDVTDKWRTVIRPDEALPYERASDNEKTNTADNQAPDRRQYYFGGSTSNWSWLFPSDSQVPK